MSAKLIMFDGPDGAGKTTQIALAKEALQKQGLTVLSTRINGGSEIGEALRTVYLSNIERPAATDYFLGQAIYAAFVREIDKLRGTCDVILVDRSPLSNIAYQSFGSGYPLEEALRGCDNTLQALRPDLLVCYIAPLATLRARLNQSSETKHDYFEGKGDDYFQKVLEGYTYSAERYHAEVIDADQDEASVHAETMRLLEKLLQTA
jgi:dTMP kinase